MGIHQRRDKSFYARCDFDDCMNVVELKAKDFWEAKDEAKKLGFITRKKDGQWVNFCTRYCEICGMQDPIIIERS
jgi:hypothetical protein